MGYIFLRLDINLNHMDFRLGNVFLRNHLNNFVKYFLLFIFKLLKHLQKWSPFANGTQTASFLQEVLLHEFSKISLEASISNPNKNK